MRKKIVVAILLGSIALINICAQLFAIYRNQPQDLRTLTAENFLYNQKHVLVVKGS